MSALYYGDIPIRASYYGDDEIATPGPNLFLLTPAENTPTFASAAVGASAAPTIAGSAGWFREKRVGVAENTPGGAQTSTAALDTTGSTRFRYPGLYSAIGHAANPGNYILTDYKPGGSPQNARWLANVEFITSSPSVQFRLRAPVTNPSFGLIYVDGLRVQERNFTYTATAGAGTGVTLTFPDARPRRILVVGLSGIEGDFGGVAVASGYTVEKTPTPTKSLAIIGDSFVAGAGTGGEQVSGTETFAWDLGRYMRADEVIQAGIGGTGWIAALSGQPTSIFDGRIANVLAMNPDIVCFAGGRNESSATGLQAAVESAINKVLVAGKQCFVTNTTANSQTAVNAAIAAACTAQGVPFYQTDIDSVPKVADAIHPSYVGHQQMAANINALM